MENFLYTLISTTSIFILSFFTVYFYFLIGNIFNYKINNNNTLNIKNIIYKCIIGLILISFIALITNFFVSLNKIINTIIYTSILVAVIFIKKKSLFQRSENCLNNYFFSKFLFNYFQQSLYTGCWFISFTIYKHFA